MKTARLLLLIILLSFVDNKVAAQCAENNRMYELGMQLFPFPAAFIVVCREIR